MMCDDVVLCVVWYEMRASPELGAEWRALKKAPMHKMKDAVARLLNALVAPTSNDPRSLFWKVELKERLQVRGSVGCDCVVGEPRKRKNKKHVAENCGCCCRGGARCN